LRPREAGRLQVLALSRDRNPRSGIPVLRTDNSYDPPVLIAGNWKMFKGQHEARAFATSIRHFAARVPAVEIVVCAPAVSIAATVQGLGSDSGVRVYAQNVHWGLEGAYTGEISAPMLLEAGATGTLVGHSERRQLFGETDETTRMRAETALEQGLSVIACVGETEAEREAGETEAVLERQVSVLPRHERLVIAYEPVWAIGTGKTATAEIAQGAHAFVKSLHPTAVLYGGSVKPDNAATLLAQPDVDGALVGGASLEVTSFEAICSAAAQAVSA
jgi:triosephosphate isomerase (TIM)